MKLIKTNSSIKRASDNISLLKSIMSLKVINSLFKNYPPGSKFYLILYDDCQYTFITFSDQAPFYYNPNLVFKIEKKNVTKVIRTRIPAIIGSKEISFSEQENIYQEILSRDVLIFFFAEGMKKITLHELLDNYTNLEENWLEFRNDKLLNIYRLNMDFYYVGITQEGVIIHFDEHEFKLGSSYSKYIDGKKLTHIVNLDLSRKYVKENGLEIGWYKILVGINENGKMLCYSIESIIGNDVQYIPDASSYRFICVHRRDYISISFKDQTYKRLDMVEYSKYTKDFFRTYDLSFSKPIDSITKYRGVRDTPLKDEEVCFNEFRYQHYDFINWDEVKEIKLS